MSKLICLLLLTAFSATIADQELENFAQKVLELLNPHGSNGKQNSLLLSLTNGELLTQGLLLGNSSVRVNVTFSGSVTISAERDAKKVNVTTQYKGGAALAENDSEAKRRDNSPVPDIPNWVNNDFIDDIVKEIVESQKSLDANESAVLLAHGADTDIGLKDNTRKLESKKKGGFVVGSKTKVTKNY